MNPPILLVDDEENDVFFMTDAFKRSGIDNIYVAQDGQQALDFLNGHGKYSDRKHFPKPALVLLDLKLPFVMGLEVLKRIRQRPNGPIVIILSASADPTDVQSAYNAGANAYLVKPSSMSALLDMVKCIKSFWLNQNISPQ